ncbi:Glycosyltransferase involved in cell wall bisynthesis [Geoalkalibacter ferrihydriticus]|uniref:Glycosyltransferase involved in cell wall bisynthesis n=1 Tax=Geoalkalibacter ferrihydriticus TaxID=392333 RepID=A0A1G9X6F4_9BACT|nr:glycosyltransferase [Geoalkalibacter ferrihydriticus]SDM92091.1 Glycosyltransferase involved in cell wall bisynthesis [Geoalkalibacter ferrihydriticus]
MKVIIVGNGPTTTKDGHFYKDKHTAHFLKDAAGLFKATSWLEPVVSIRDLEKGNLLASEIDSRVALLNKATVRHGRFGKVFDYLRLFSLFLAEARRSDCVYLFFNGHLPWLCALTSVLVRKRFGLYIRCDFTPRNFFDRMIVTHAHFILANGEELVSRVRPFNPRVNLVAPMIDFSADDLFTRDVDRFGKAIKLLFVGRLERAKGVYVLLDAVSILYKKDIVISLDVVGGGAEYDALVEYSTRLGISKSVHFHGLIKDKDKLKKMYQGADIFVLPSFNEGFPRVVYEAMLSSLPIITTAVGSIPSLLVHEKSALFVPKNDSNALADAIEVLIRNSQLRKILSDGSACAILEYLSRFDVTHAMQVKKQFGEKIASV